MMKARTQVETAMERALRPGTFIGYGAGFDFVQGLEAVAEQIAQLVVAGDAALGAELYESFIAVSHEKAEEIDDSGGNFGFFVASLFSGWVRARDASGADPEATITRLMQWMDVDSYGFSHRLEETVTTAMSRATLETFASRARVRMESSAPDDGCVDGYPRRRWTGVLKHTLRRLGDATRYLEFCESTEGVGAEECNAMAEMLAGRGDLAGALTWVERGLAGDEDGARDAASEFDLRERRRDLLVRLDRRDEAIEIAWSEFETHPGSHTYEVLMDLLPEAARSEWHERAVRVGEKARLGTAAELFVKTNEQMRLGRRIDEATDAEIAKLPYYIAEDAAAALAGSYPGQAARLYRSLAFPILQERKSRLYPKALRCLEGARDCYVRDGQADVWEALVGEIRHAHRRKTGFLAGFERVVAGVSSVERAPSLIERARKRWIEGTEAAAGGEEP
jgi:hypothetical protein